MIIIQNIKLLSDAICLSYINLISCPTVVGDLPAKMFKSNEFGLFFYSNNNKIGTNGKR